MILTMGGMDNISEEYSSTLYKVPNDHLKWEKGHNPPQLGNQSGCLEGYLTLPWKDIKKTGKNMIGPRKLPPTYRASGGQVLFLSE